MKPYSALSSVYEYLICDCDYRKWSQYLLSKLSEYVRPNASGLDLACGSGYFTRWQKKNGFSVTGVDISEEMLTVAKQKAVKEGLNVNFLKQDISNLKTFEKVDYVTVVNDGINYIPQKKLLKTFKNIYKSLNVNGYLFFDVSSEYKLKNVLGNNLFGEDRDDCAYLWFNKLGEGFVDFDITLFIRNGESYLRFEENHRQYIHTEREILQSLKESGFHVVECTGHLGSQKTQTTERLQFIARK
ncbi:MAG: class I SAM-dependent methyltransferase [Christensenellaceae bacterium]